MSTSRVYGERLLRAAMRCHPRAFRREYDHEMVDYYRAVMGTEGLRRGALWRRWFLWKCVVSAVRRGLTQRVRRHGRALDHRVDNGVPARSDRSDALGPVQRRRVIEGDYFDAVGINVVRGRMFGPQDRADDPDLLVVNQSAVEALFPDRADPIGSVLEVASERKEIIGVVEDVPINARGEVSSILYHLHRQFADDRNWSLRYTVKLARPDAGFLDRARETLAAIDPNLVLHEPALLADVLSDKRAAERFSMSLLAAFASVALLLTAVGIYGILAQSVSRSRHEIGVRVALGARGRDVQAMVVRQGLRLAAGGIVIGVAGAFLGARLLDSLVFEVSVWDPIVFATVPIAVLIVALAASWIPAARATRVDPAEAFRAE